MDRIEAIKAYKERNDQRAKDKAEALERRRAELSLAIRDRKERIQKLIETANVCVESGIEINRTGHYGYSQSDDKWERGAFCTNGISHKIGFVWHPNEKIYEMGINGGGANGEHYLRTNGDCVCDAEGELPNINQMERFLENFDRFEKAFYDYIDKIIAE